MTELLGKKAKDTFNGFEGRVTCVAHYVTGCVYVLLEGMDKDGNPIEHWTEDKRVEVVAEKKVTKRKTVAKRTPSKPTVKPAPETMDEKLAALESDERPIRRRPQPLGWFGGGGGEVLPNPPRASVPRVASPRVAVKP